MSCTTAGRVAVAVQRMALPVLGVPRVRAVPVVRRLRSFPGYLLLILKRPPVLEAVAAQAQPQGPAFRAGGRGLLAPR